jgi:Peptidase A4 family
MRAWFVSVVIAAACLGLPASALGDDGSSSNWAGFAVHGASFHRVVGLWRQPNVTCNPGQASYSAYWVGLGGYSGSALEQIGTEADCDSNGQPQLSAWYEMVPAASVTVSLRINAGDLMEGVVTVTGHRATLILRDLTRRRLFQISLSAAQIDVTSAEWIVEAPSDCSSTCVTLPLANFSSTTFVGARAEAGGHWGAISDRAWRATSISLNPTGAHTAGAQGGSPGAAVPSALSAAGTAFTVAFRPGGSSQMSVRRQVLRAGRLVHPAER